MDELDTGKLRAVIAKATPGEWFVANGGVGARQVLDNGNVVCLEPENMMAASLDKWPANAAYIAAFDPPTTTALLDTIDTLRQQLAEARAATLEEAATIADEHAPGGEYYERDHDEGSMRGAIAKTLRNLASEASHD